MPCDNAELLVMRRMVRTHELTFQSKLMRRNVRTHIFPKYMNDHVGAYDVSYVTDSSPQFISYERLHLYPA